METGSQVVTSTRLSLSEARILLGIGLAVALMAGFVFRIVGQLVLDPSRPLLVTAVFALTVPVMWTLAVGIFRWRGLSGGAKREAAVLLVVPGMLIDAVSTSLFSVVYPNMSLAAAGLFGGLLLLAYATVLVAGFVAR
ncbi:hypothetical protein E6P09_11340 [Haloferax mediterranei ATCC 33500]|uniref:Uncharacterized protein n=1 Tax=Haloferax mediterranei (strain ATCC 33500 / DSM 1411 / JCM 8866 / NBRC 14739 / NCIMB 2177 / R-4) TaxID=523841 RepID=I3R558_HALMT|nr:DUF5367 family protein [Haloferax mediterranei]AFK19368.1 hypothetical protein HFX_1662 [Haloferax mediterranei ATCC 33500]AHZ21280.1 hypothetical protein BM92_00795 [Haloferax mediterranei ATCC 33500]EMA04441.1 hypothetical protein C439_02162 [Haloferax mediterranei ATCC 33500]MDX5989472.1 DUF5367 family protein [Haloferax mediterranei ATCC 33500]QCQ75833.1 hypothetical protein E6P09_11340 [Haloferax mediterranei ATCC 33500]